MTDETKNTWDIVLQVITMIAAAFAFWVGLRQWRRGQHWQRAERMDIEAYGEPESIRRLCEWLEVKREV